VNKIQEYRQTHTQKKTDYILGRGSSGLGKRPEEGDRIYNSRAPFRQLVSLNLRKARIDTVQI
jgi:hypothetical protein